MPGAPPKKDRKEYNEAQELENLQRVFDRLDKKGDKKARCACAARGAAATLKQGSWREREKGGSALLSGANGRPLLAAWR